MKAEYKIVIKKSAVKEIKTLPDIYLKKVLKKFPYLLKNQDPQFARNYLNKINTELG